MWFITRLILTNSNWKPQNHQNQNVTLCQVGITHWRLYYSSNHNTSCMTSCYKGFFLNLKWNQQFGFDFSSCLLYNTLYLSNVLGWKQPTNEGYMRMRVLFPCFLSTTKQNLSNATNNMTYWGFIYTFFLSFSSSFTF